MKFHYETNCVSCGDGEAIQEMKSNDVRITYKTMLKRCRGVLEWAKDHGYVVHGDGLKLKHDQMVGFHKSKFRGKPCYFISWSGIEYIWSKP